MTKFICPRCHLNTHIKTHFKRHLSRKNICKALYKDVPIKDILESYGIEISSTDIHSVTPNVTLPNGVTVTRNPIPYTNSSPISNNIEKNVTLRHHCEYCNKSYATRQGKYKHKKYCKSIKTQKQTTKKIYTQKELEIEITKKEERIKKEAENKAKLMADEIAQELVLSFANKLIPSQTTNSHNTNSHNTQNNNIQNNIQNNNNLKINNFGKENTKYISDERLKIMFVDPRNTVIQHIKDTHYHLLHPENFNAKITNYKSKHMKIYEDNGWVTVNKKATICSMYSTHERIMNNEFERLKSELPDIVRNNYTEYKQTAHSNYHTYQQRLIDTEAVIITGTQQQKNIDLLRKEEVLRLAKEQNKTPSEIFAEHMPDIFAEREKRLEEQGL